ncbi:MAG: hypothetical protein ACLQVN_22915 [Bryobacteraceae bacterium]
MKTKLMALMLLAGSAAFAGPRFFFGVRVGIPDPVVAYAPPVAPAYVGPAYGPAYVAPCPGPGYTWATGFYGPGRVWHAGYWARPYVGAAFVGPHYVGGHGYRGYARR